MAGSCVQDSPTVVLTTPGTPRNIRADVRVSADPGNVVQAHGDGLFVAAGATQRAATQWADSFGFVEGGLQSDYFGGNVAGPDPAYIYGFIFVSPSYTSPFDAWLSLDFSVGEFRGQARAGEGVLSVLWTANLAVVRQDDTVIIQRAMRSQPHVVADGGTITISGMDIPLVAPIPAGLGFHMVTNIALRTFDRFDNAKHVDGGSYGTCALAYHGVA